MAPALVIHGHFYQPPRENPWTDDIDAQPSAAPFHDWNERVHAECYRPNAFAKVPTDKGELIVNNYDRLSFDVGPTLLSWMEHADPETYTRIIEADRKSIERLGHGNALAQAFHHTILPLSPLRDVRTQVRWGLADFLYRFRRPAEGMWLPETAVDDDTLGVLIDEGLRFTILAPHQAASWREIGGRWNDVGEEGIDTRVSYRYLHRDGSGRSIAIFFYDSQAAQAIAFGNAASSAESLIDMLTAKVTADDHLAHVATDGETYGHHSRFGDLGLAYALFIEAERRGIQPSNYARFLEDFPPQREVRVGGGEGSSWSCAHGVGRWARDCGCSTGGQQGWDQAWRRPLRSAVEIVRETADEAFDRLGNSLFLDPWRARDSYLEVKVGKRTLEELLRAEASGPLNHDDQELARRLLDMQCNAMSMFTSCGWFFSDIGGIETVQVLRYAARTLDLLDALSQPNPRDKFLATLEEAKSNDPEMGTGADIFQSIEIPLSQSATAQADS